VCNGLKSPLLDVIRLITNIWFSGWRKAKVIFIFKAGLLLQQTLNHLKMEIFR
jgi:hypothetical protein